jgi:ribosomal protein S18 acetylase RimI-like enzyme
MRIRAARLEDAPEIADVEVRSWQQAYRGLLPAAYLDGLFAGTRRVAWERSLRRGSPAILVAQGPQGLSGFTAFGRCRDEDARPTDHEIQAMYLVPDSWRQGIGRQLWRAAREAMAAQGATRITLWVNAGNERAIAFYRALGFVHEPGAVVSFQLAGMPQQGLRLVHALGRVS